MTELESVLKTHFGFSQFRPGQKAIIQAVLAGNDTLGVLPTGSGKTLCYQLPALLLPGTVVVIEPLLALIEDQVGRLQASGEKRVVALSSRLTPGDFATILTQLDQARFVFMAPETLARPDVQARLAAVTVSLFVVDEAHCISQWGPDFRPAYLKIGAILRQLHPHATLALTATAPARVQEDIVTGLGLTQPQRLIASVDRPNLFLGVETVASAAAKQARVLALVTQVQGPKILYFDRKRSAEAYATWLQQQGQSAAYYHAGLTAEQRELIQRQFMADQLSVICATSAFGMGIDKPDVRLVVYLHVPDSLEAYAQGIGRAGRDGKPALTLLVMAPGDLDRAAQFAASLPDEGLIATIFKHPEAYQDFEDPQVALVEAYIQAGFDQAAVRAQLASRRGEKQASFTAMAQYVQAPGCKRAALMAYFDSPAAPHQAFCCGPVTPDAVAQLPAVAPPAPKSSPEWSAIFRAIFKMN